MFSEGGERVTEGRLSPGRESRKEKRQIDGSQTRTNEKGVSEISLTPLILWWS